MKNIQILFLLISTYSYSQLTWETGTTSPEYQSIKKIEISRGDVKKYAKQWVVKIFNNSNYVIKSETEDEIITKGVFKGMFRDGLGSKRNGKFNFELSIEFKENKYRFTMTNFTIESENSEYQFIANQGMYKPADNPEEFAKGYRSYVESTYPKLGKKTLLKSLENQKKVERLRLRQKKYFDVIEPQIILQTSAMDNSLFKHISEKSKDEW